jgi:[Skp1-protein]-hydroxyproline N-acetylglucosaminyltransferase
MSINIKSNTIFVSIASYRDNVCTKTVQSLYEMADNPNKVFVGLCQQNNNKEDPECITNEIRNKYLNNIRIIRIPYFDAKGPTWARYLCSTLWDGEEYYFQIDSHTKFVKGWDTLCINMINLIINSGLSLKPVLSHYPKEYEAYENYNPSEKHNVPRMCKSFFNKRDMLSFMGAEVINTNNIPYNTPYLASGMFFCQSYFLNELPYDPNLDYLFVGEEILHSIRFYTNGWDIYTPTENIIFHEYERKDKPKIWTDNPYYSDLPAFNKVKYYIGLMEENGKNNLDKHISNNLDKYGLGTVRSLDDYYRFTDIDIANKKVYTNFCKENNKATDDDIFNSNEHNHKKEQFGLIKENFLIFHYDKFNLIIFLIILILLYLFLFNKSN